MAYHYVTSSQPPTSVTHAVVCNFTGAGEKTLIIGKSTRLEAHRVEDGELAPVFDVAVYGRIATIDVLSAPEGVSDFLPELAAMLHALTRHRKRRLTNYSS